MDSEENFGLDSVLIRIFDYHVPAEADPCKEAGISAAFVMLGGDLRGRVLITGEVFWALGKTFSVVEHLTLEH